MQAENEIILELIEDLGEFMDKVREAINGLKMLEAEDMARALRGGLLAELEMRRDNDHSWMARSSPTLKEMLEWE